MNPEIKKTANLLISMSTEYLTGNYDEELYVNMLVIIGKQLQEKLITIKK